MDSLHVVKGDAPKGASCEVVVTSGADVLRREEVNGSFEVTYIAAGPLPSKVDVTAYCGGRSVKEIKGIAPRSVGDVELGKLQP